MLPPGTMGLPVLGETMAFLHDPFGFLEDRRRRFGPIFRSNVVFRKVVFLSGLDGAEAFFDPGNVTRSDAHPFPLVTLFGGVNMEMYDGPGHVALKTMAVASFDRDAIAGYLPEMQALIETTLARLASGREFAAVPALRRLAVQAICRNVLGLAPGPRTDAIAEDYATTLSGLKAIPFPIPGSTFGRARAARDRLLDMLRTLIAERRAHPGADGLSRMLLAEAHGRAYTDEEALLEVHHILIAGFIVYALMAEPLRRLAEQPELRDRCEAEVRGVAPEGPLTIEQLERLPTCLRVVMEAKRTTPLVPLAFGRAQRGFSVGGYDVPGGWTVWLALYLHNRDPEIFREPDRFEPARFGPERMEQLAHPMAFIPQGVEPPAGHRCLGLDYSTYLTQCFVALLVRGYGWELPAQDLTLDFRRLPPVPRDGLLVRLSPRTGRV